MLVIDRELKSLLVKLTAENIPHTLCGGLAMAAHGHPRATQDIDLVAFDGSTPQIEKAAHSLGFIIACGSHEIRRWPGYNHADFKS